MIFSYQMELISSDGKVWDMHLILLDLLIYTAVYNRRYC